MQTDERATAGQQVDACLLSTAGDVGAAGWRDGSYGNEQCVGKSTCASAGWIAPLRVRERKAEESNRSGCASSHCSLMARPVRCG